MLSREDFDKLSKQEQDALIAKMAEIQSGQKAIEAEAAAMPKLSMKELEGKIQEVAEAYIKRMTAVDKKFFAFPGIGTEGLDAVDAGAKFAKTRRFLRALVGGDVSVARQMSEEVRVKANLSENTGSEGGYLVPEEFQAEILRLAPVYGVIRRECRMIPMGTDVINIPAAGSTNQSAIWTAEAGQIKNTDPNLNQVTLTVNKLAAIPKVTNELLQDAKVPVIAYLSELIAEAFALEEDNQGFNGTGSPFVGVTVNTGSPARAISGTIACLSYPDLIKATTDIYDNALSNAKFYFHRSVIGHIRSLITTAGAPIFPATAKEIAGYPIVSTEKLVSFATLGASSGSYFGIFGDLRKGYAIGEKGAISMKLSTEGTVGSDNLFEKDMVALRAIERIAMATVLPSAFLRLRTG